MSKPLTAIAVEKLKAEAIRREIPDGGLTGLYLVIQPTGRKSWAIRYRHAGKPRKATIGPYPAFDLKKAREAAGALLRAAAEGADPAREKIEARALAIANLNPDDTIEKQIAAFIERHVSRNRSASEVKRLLRKEVVSAWGEKRVSEIKRGDVVRLLDKIVDRGAPYTANRVFANLRKFANWSVSRGLIERSFCEGVTAPAAELKRDRVLEDHELSLVWRAANGMGFPFGPFVKLLILTGQRREEVAGMRWPEVDLQKAVWTIPRERAKNDKAHVVALSPQAVSVLSALPKIAGRKEGRMSADFIFTTTGHSSISGFSRAKDYLDAGIEKLTVDDDADPAPSWRLHDIRRTVASGMARLGISIAVVEKILNHTSGTFSGIVAVYQRHEFLEERRKALEAWGLFVEALVAEGPDDAKQAETAL